MIALEDIVAAAMTAPPERREEALRLLRGELPKSEPLLTLRGLSRKTGYGVSTLRRWEPPFHNIGGARRYRLSEVEKFFLSEAFARRVAALRAERKQVEQSRKLRVIA